MAEEEEIDALSLLQSRDTRPADKPSTKRASDVRHCVLAYLLEQGRIVTSGHELSAAIGLPRDMAWPRGMELVPAGSVVVCGRRRRICTGPPATVGTVRTAAQGVQPEPVARNPPITQSGRPTRNPKVARLASPSRDRSVRGQAQEFAWRPVGAKDLPSRPRPRHTTRAAGGAA